MGPSTSPWTPRFRAWLFHNLRNASTTLRTMSWAWSPSEHELVDLPCFRRPKTIHPFNPQGRFDNMSIVETSAFNSLLCLLSRVLARPWVFENRLVHSKNQRPRQSAAWERCYDYLYPCYSSKIITIRAAKMLISAHWLALLENTAANIMSQTIID